MKSSSSAERGRVHPALSSDSESGIGLVELLIYVMLAVLVFSVAGSIFINGLRAEAIVRTATESTSAGQLALESIQRGVRNSSGLNIIIPDGRSHDQLLKVRTASGGTNIVYTCEAWYYSESEGTIRMESAPDGIPLKYSDPLTWTLLTQGVAPGASGKVFAMSDSGAEVTIDFTVTARERAPIVIHSSARSRTSSTEAPSCV